MHYTKFHDKSISLLGLGVMRMPQTGEAWGSPIIHDKAEELLDYCIEAGINYLDTAFIYHGGESETFLGRVMKKYPRERFYIADKYNIIAMADYRTQFEEQRKRLDMDCIDFYLLHGIGDLSIDNYFTNGCIEYFMEQRERGRISHLGFSFHASPHLMPRVLARHAWDFAMIQLNYFDWFHVSAKVLYEHLRNANIPIMVMEPIHGGLLANLTDEGNAMLRTANPNASIASWALRFVLGLPGITCILSGMSNMEQARDNIKTIVENMPLTKTQEDLLLRASTLKFETIGAACTSCKYCLKDCPQQLDMPYLINAYNDYKSGGPWRLNRLKALPEDKRPAACTSCQECLRHCPQNLDIPALMSDMANTMKGA